MLQARLQNPVTLCGLLAKGVIILVGELENLQGERLAVEDMKQQKAVYQQIIHSRWKQNAEKTGKDRARWELVPLPGSVCEICAFSWI